MCFETWIIGIAVSNVMSEYILARLYFTQRVRDMRFET